MYLHSSHYCRHAVYFFPCFQYWILSLMVLLMIYYMRYISIVLLSCALNTKNRIKRLLQYVQLRLAPIVITRLAVGRVDYDRDNVHSDSPVVDYNPGVGSKRLVRLQSRSKQRGHRFVCISQQMTYLFCAHRSKYGYK